MDQLSSNLDDRALFEAARLARPSAKRFSLESRRLSGADEVEWVMRCNSDLRQRETHWHVVARAKSRAALLLLIRSIDPAKRCRNVESLEGRSEPSYSELLAAGKARWGGEHLVVGEGSDGIRRPCWLFAERGNVGDERDLVTLLEASSRRELLELIESAAQVLRSDAAEAVDGQKCGES